MKTKEVSPPAYTLFDTALGQCAIVWRQSARKDAVVVIGFQLPEASPRAAERRMIEKWGASKAGSVPPLIRAIIRRVTLHFTGRIQAFGDIELELDKCSPFVHRIYEAAREVEAGATSSYGKIAEAAGRAGAARAVGWAMRRNPVPLIIPCHRILAAGKKPGGFSAHGGLDTKARMLELEGVALVRPDSIRTEKDLYRAAALLRKQDPRLGSVLSRPIEFMVKRKESPYHTLVRAVVYQQLSQKAAETILGRLVALYDGKELPEPAELVGTSDSQLRSAGLSRSKSKSLKDIAARALDGTIPNAKEIMVLGDGEIMRRLTTIYGVGRWTVQMMLIFNLGRMDVLPVDDYALRTNMADVLKMDAVPTPTEATRLGEIWKPYRTIASLCLWTAGNRNASAEN